MHIKNCIVYSKRIINKEQNKMITSIFIIAAIGLCITLYAAFIEYRLYKNPSYKPVCDLSDRVSCSKTFLSPYSKILKVSNTILGDLFYSGMMFLAWFEYTTLAWYGALSGAFASVFFAYILFFKVRTICLLCISIYLVNIALLYVTYINR